MSMLCCPLPRTPQLVAGEPELDQPRAVTLSGRRLPRVPSFTRRLGAILRFVEDIALQVIAGLLVVAIGGAGAWALRRAAAGRSSRAVKFLAKVTDYGDPDPFFVTWRTGLILDVEVHPLGPDRISIREVGLETEDRSRIELGTVSNLNQTLSRPEYVEASNYMNLIRQDVAKTGSKVRGFYAIVTPDVVHRQSLPDGWDGFPEYLPAEFGSR